MKRFKGVLALILALALALLVAGCGAAGGQSSQAAPAAAPAPAPAAPAAGGTSINTGSIKPNADTTVIQMGHCNPGTDIDHYTHYCRQLSDYLMQNSNGKYAIEVMSDTQLGAERDLFEGLTLGTVDAAIVTNMVVAASIDIANVFELPFVYNTEDQVYGLMQDESFTKPLRDTLYNDWSIYCPVLIEGGFRKTVTNREFRDIPSLTGQKLRAPESRIFLETFSAIGANPTSMSLPEAVTGLQQGVVDGMEIVIPSINSIGLYEMADYVVATDHIYTCAEICFSRSFWDNLPAEEQAWFNDACVKAAADEVKFVREMNELNIQKFKDSGCTYIPASEVDRASMRQAVQPLLDDYRDIIGAELFDKAMAAVA